VEVQWRFRSTSFGKRWTSYNAPPSSRKRAADLHHFEISFLGATFSWLEKPRNRMRRDSNWILCSAWKTWTVGTPLEHPPYSPDLAPCDFWALSTMKGSSEARNFEVVNCLQHVSKKWVERCKNASLAKGGASKKRPSPPLHKIPTGSNKVSPRTFQTALVLWGPVNYSSVSSNSEGH
jgi:hypothetical protein